ncbi:MAG: hypothetical protein AB1758_38430, partial [Candidatus Eremiobacterota bacterium]
MLDQFQKCGRNAPGPYPVRRVADQSPSQSQVQFGYYAFRLLEAEQNLVSQLTCGGILRAGAPTDQREP